MPLQAGHQMSGQGCCPQILEENGICAQLVQLEEVLPQVGELILPDQGVDGDIHPHPSQMSIIYGLSQVGMIEVCGESSCSKSPAAQVDSICACCYGCVQGL